MMLSVFKRWIMKKVFIYLSLILIAFVGCFATSAIADRSSRFLEIDRAIVSEGFHGGIQRIKLTQGSSYPLYSKQNSVSLFLDLGLLEFYHGEHKNSINNLLNAERLIQETYTKSVSENITSYILNDNTKEYPGEDFEDIYINIFNAISFFILGDIDGALVEIRKLTHPSGKLELLQRKYNKGNEKILSSASYEMQIVENNPSSSKPILKKTSFTNSALARYLSVIFYEAESNYDAVRIEKDQLRNAYINQHSIYLHPIPSAIENIGTIGKTTPRLDFICFTGLSPVKKEESFYQYLPIFTNYLLHHMELKLPVLKKRTNRIDKVEILISNMSTNLELLEDVSAIIEDTYNARFSNMFIKAYVRTLTKYVAQDIASNAVDKNNKSKSEGTNLITALGKITTKIAIDATERADVRMARYLPDKVFVGNVDIDPGFYTLTINYFSNEKILKTEIKENIEVKERTLNIVHITNLDLNIPEGSKK